MIKDKIQTIIDTLLEATSSDNINCIEQSSSKNRLFERYFCAFGEDTTKYKIDIKFSIDYDKSAWIIESKPSLWIENDILPESSIFVYGGSYNIKPLRDMVKDKFCADMNPSIGDFEKKLDDISKSISLSTYRDIKIGDILK